MESNQSTNTDIKLPKHEDILIEYVKEKDSLRSDLKEKEQEILKLRSKVYDLSQKLDEMKKKPKAKGKENSVATDSPQLSLLRVSTGKTKTPVMKRSKTFKRKKTKTSVSSIIDQEGELLRADIAKYTDVREVIEHYLDVAAKFPDLRLSDLLEAENFFYENDVNKDGHIDEKEMENVLIKQGYLLTDAELQKIMNQVDVDESKSIDLMEYLAVLEKIRQRKKVDLPQQLVKSKMCVIQ